MSNYVVCHYAKCYGPPVSYTTHIERKKADGTEHVPYNIKRSDLTKHNREFIPEAKKTGRTAAIEKRLMAVKRTAMSTSARSAKTRCAASRSG